MNTTKTQIIDAIAALHNDESGATATEYVILLVLIACFAIAVVKAFGGTLSEKYEEANKAVKEQVTING